MQNFLAGMDNLVFFGVNDPDTGDFLERRLGPATVPVAQQSAGGGRSRGRDHTGLENTSRSHNDGWSLSEVGRPLLQASEATRLDERRALVLTPGVRPFCTRLVRHYEPEFRDAPGPSRGTGPGLAASCLAFMASGLVAAALAISAAAAAYAPVPHGARDRRVEQSSWPPADVPPGPPVWSRPNGGWYGR